MKSQEEFQDAAERAFELLEQKSPHQLAVELVSMEDRVQGAIDACARMQEQRDQLAFQLKDATAQCGVMADLLRELREGARVLRYAPRRLPAGQALRTGFAKLSRYSG